ncbi:hypothetical protein KBC75_02625 [Candidatus Shapirobacteria bacterium]|nr:hypothetical protein [Candidatus Shapirobacteria bacterium]
MAKYEEKIRARELRLKGKSIGNIARIVGAGKSTVSIWCQDIFLSEIQKDVLKSKGENLVHKGRLVASENRKRERLSRVEQYKIIGINKVGKISKRELFLIGAGLYWAEGGKNQRKVVFINSDSKMILFWVSWITKCLGVTRDRITCRVEINEIHRNRIEIIESYWSKLINIPLSQFTKPSFKHSKVNKIYKNSDEYFGSLQLTIKKGTNLNYEILGYMEGLASVA